MSELLPCPFCGGRARLMRYARLFMVICDNEDCTRREVLHETERGAVESWNHRTERTCTNTGYCIDSTRFKCSECGYNGWTKYAKDGRDRVPRYCPDCGAKVVRDVGA